MDNISVDQFEALVTQRVLYRALSASAIRNGFRHSDLVYKSSYTGNEILRDFGLGDVCRCQVRGFRVFLFHKQNRRVIAELALVGDIDARTRLERRPKFYLLGRRGFIKNQPLAELVGSVGRLSKYERKRNGKTH